MRVACVCVCVLKRSARVHNERVGLDETSDADDDVSHYVCECMCVCMRASTTTAAAAAQRRHAQKHTGVTTRTQRRGARRTDAMSVCMNANQIFHVKYFPSPLTHFALDLHTLFLRGLLGVNSPCKTAKHGLIEFPLLLYLGFCVLCMSAIN